MFATSYFVLWMSVILLAVSVLALHRRVSRLRQDGAAAGTGATVRTAILPLISAPTLAGDIVTIGGASRDGRPLLLLFLRADCVASAQALRTATSLCEPERLRLIVLGEGDRDAYGTLVRPYHIRDSDIILHAGIGAEIGVCLWPSAVLIAGDGAVLADGAVGRRDEMEALLARLSASPAPSNETIRSVS